jgi:hypothetical protein
MIVDLILELTLSGKNSRNIGKKPASVNLASIKKGKTISGKMISSNYFAQNRFAF